MLEIWRELPGKGEIAFLGLWTEERSSNVHLDDGSTQCKGKLPFSLCFVGKENEKAEFHVVKICDCNPIIIVSLN